MSKLREFKTGDLVTVEIVIMNLRDIRDRLKRVGAHQTVRKIRSALKSAEGARRHIIRIKNEKERRTNEQQQQG